MVGLSDSPAARVTAGLVAAIILGGTALYAVNRAERLTMADVAGIYRMEPSARGEATDRIHHQRLAPDGRTWLETIHLVDGPHGLRTTVSIDSAGARRWMMEDGRLCIGHAPRRTCSTVARDPVTGDLMVGDQRLTRLRSSAVVD